MADRAQALVDPLWLQFLVVVIAIGVVLVVGIWTGGFTDGQNTTDPANSSNETVQRYVSNIDDGPTGQNITVVAASYTNGTLTVHGQLSPTSLFPIDETISGIEEEYFTSHEQYPVVQKLRIEVTNCRGDVIAAREVKRPWLDRFWNKSTNMTVGEYTELKLRTHDGLRELDLSTERHENTEQSTWTCADWISDNPALLNTTVQGDSGS